MFDRKTLLFVLFSVGILFFWQKYIAPPPVSAPLREESSPLPSHSQGSASGEVVGQSVEQGTLVSSGELVPVAIDGVSPVRESIKVETNLFTAVIDSKSASLTSYRLKEHLLDNSPLDLLLTPPANSPVPGAFYTTLGSVKGAILEPGFYVKKISDTEVIFQRDFQLRQSDGTLSAPFSFEKRFKFSDDNYLFQLEIMLANSVNEAIPLGANGYAYSLDFGPEIGPSFTKMDKRNVYRRFYYLSGEKETQIKTKTGAPVENILNQTIKWGGVTGKYFASVVIPPNQTDFSVWEYKESDTFFHQYGVQRPLIKSSLQTDTYYIYMGPRIESPMVKYNDSGKNPWGLRDLQLEKMIDSGGWLAWLEVGLKWSLDLFYGWIPNYGIAIIFLTILIKLFLFPLTQKSYKSTSRMQKIQPMMKELQEKYKGNPQKLNVEMGKLYRTYGVNPAAGCLPLLIQFPFFIAIYQMLNKNFDLRGAVFIPGWITDLSTADLVYTFEVGNWTLPLRLLPLFYLGTQLLMGKTMQPPGGGAGGINQKMFTIYMPIMFTFIMYNFPSGLLIYWSSSNLLTLVQQKVGNRLQKNKGEDELVPQTRKKSRFQKILEESQQRGKR